MKVAVVIPIYKSELSWFEKISLEQVLKVLNNYPIIFVSPDDLEFNYLPTETSYLTIKFSKKYFESVSSYSRLMLSVDFYKYFLDYEYILIYQLDAFVFSDQLLRFCQLEYDYIGAPWPLRVGNYKNEVLYVGNGGFSLRKVKSCLKLIKEQVDMLASFTANEDIFFSYNGKLNPNKFRVAPVNIAMKFSFDILPKRYYKKNGNKLPFGCHAWNRFGIDFYEKMFANYGYDLSPYMDLMIDDDAEIKRKNLLYIATQRLIRRINNGQSLIKYLPKNEGFHICMFGEQADLLLYRLYSEGLKILDSENIHIIKNDKQLQPLSEDMKRMPGQYLLIALTDDFSLISNLKSLGLDYGKDFISFRQEYMRHFTDLFKGEINYGTE